MLCVDGAGGFTSCAFFFVGWSTGSVVVGRMRDSGSGHVVLRDTGSGLDVSGGSGFEGLPNFGLSAMAVSSAK